MNHIDALIKNNDNDGFLYMEAHSPSGDPRIQEIWQINATVSPSESVSSWTKVIGGVKVNGGGGEAGQTWVKKGNVFFTAAWCTAAPAAARDWGWHYFYTTNSAGEVVTGGANVEQPVHQKSSEGWSACGQNIGSVITQNSPTDIIAIGTNRDQPGNGDDAQIRRFNGTSLTTLQSEQCGTNYINYSVSVLDSAFNGYFLDSYNTHTNAHYIWTAPSLNINANLSNISPTILMPGSQTGDRPVDLSIIESPKLAGGTILAVSIVTNGLNERLILLYNATSNMMDNAVAPLDITAGSGVQEWRGRLASYDTYLFASYDVGGEEPGLRRLNILNEDLSSIGVFFNPGAPEVFVTTGDQMVSNEVTAITVTGSNTASVVGSLTWLISLNGSNGSVAAAAPAATWNISAPLAQGDNVITVTGTNILGNTDSDFVTITRDAPKGYGTPVIMILNGDVTVGDATTTYNLNGTANLHVVGNISWSNTQTGAEGSLPALASWTINSIALASGKNTITVWGTNYISEVSSKTTDIIRKPNYNFEFGNVILPEIISNAFQTTSLGSDGTNLYYSRCQADDGFYSLPADSTDSWTSLAPYPFKNPDFAWETGDGFWFKDGYLYQFSNPYTNPYPRMRTPIRYDVAGNDWEFGNSFDGCGANAAAVVDNSGNIFGMWKGHNLIQMIPGFNATSVGFDYGTAGGAVHAVDSTRSPSTIYFVRPESYEEDFGRVYSIPANGTATQGDVKQFVKTPWQLGMGVSIDYVPSTFSISGYDELWLLRGAGLDANPAGDEGFETTDLGIYNIGQDYWITYVLSNYYTGPEELFFADGSDMCRVDDLMFFLTAPLGDESSMLLATQLIPEPFTLGGVFMAILFAMRNRVK